MFENSFTMQTIEIMRRGLDAAALRHEVIADNLANIDTPDFKKSYVTFEDELKFALSRPPKPSFVARQTDPRHLVFDEPGPSVEDVKSRVLRQTDTIYRKDGNNVDIDIEMTELAKNTIQYDVLSRQISTSFQRILDTIRSLRSA